MENENKIYDVAVVGAGVVGTAIAQELSKFSLESVLLEAKSDIGAGTSKANTAIWHTGFDAKTGSLEQRLLSRGYKLLLDYVPQFGIPHEKSGAVLIAWNEDQLNSLTGILEKAHNNGVADVHMLTVEEVYKLEPEVNSGALGGLMVPGEFIICPFSIPLSFATQAVLNDVKLLLNFPVTDIIEENDVYTLSGSGGTVKSKYVINAAGLNSDVIDRLLGFERFKVTPRRGELIVFDKLARNLVNHVLLPVPTSITKGVLVSPTVFGNIMLGPTAEDLDDKEATNTSTEGLEFLWKKGEGIISKLLDEEVTSTYAGLRAATEHSDYQIYSHPDKRYICVGGIRSTGLSSSLGIAEYILELLNEAGITPEKKTSLKSVKMPNIGQKEHRPYETEELIKENEDYGRVVCHCERVTLGEIKDALHSPVPAKTLEGLRRRTRSMQGRCQGFYCSADVNEIFESETKNKNVETSNE
ncbi:MAG: NAD(P)/FAD-dependent oxidoreductase [Bacteroidota bacterium]